MAHVTDDRIMETTTTTGTGALTLAGAVAGFRAFSAKMTSPSDTCFYMIEAVDTNGIPTGDWETGLGTYTAASTLTRTTVSRSSNADAAVTLAAGTKRVAIVDIAATCLTATVVPIAPIAGQINIGRVTIAGRDQIGVQPIHYGAVTLQSDLATNRVSTVLGTGLSSFSTWNAAGSQWNPLGTQTARLWASTNIVTRARRIGLVSAATAASMAAMHNGGTECPTGTLGIGGFGGFTATFLFSTSDPATVSGARMFVGVRTSTATPSNVDPAGLTNVIGVAQLAASTNLQIVFGGSAAQTPIDLGVNFPAATLSTDLYRLVIFSSPSDNTKVGYQVTRWTGTSNVPAFETSGSLANTTPGTNLPDTNTGLRVAMWRTNNATALSVAIDLCQMSIETLV